MCVSIELYGIGIILINGQNEIEIHIHSSNFSYGPLLGCSLLSIRLKSIDEIQYDVKSSAPENHIQISFDIDQLNVLMCLYQSTVMRGSKM